MRVEGLKAIARFAPSSAHILFILFGVKNDCLGPELTLHELLLSGTHETFSDNLAVHRALGFFEIVRSHLLLAEIEDLTSDALEIFRVGLPEISVVEEFGEA